MARAEEREASGRLEEASSLYAQAASYEALALDQIPTARVRTRGIIGISAVSLFVQGGRWLEGLRLAHRLLADNSLPDDARDQLLEIALDAERHRNAAKEGRVLSGETFVVSLRGDSVRPGGLTPLDTVVLKLQQFRGYVIRVGEWVDHRPFRAKGNPPADVARACTPLIAPARAGSYQFELHLESPSQLDMFESQRRLSPETVAREFFRVLDYVTSDESAFSGHVEDPQYRDAFAKLIRALVPNGEDLLEVEILSKRTGASAFLIPPMRDTIQKRILVGQPAGEHDRIRHGVLRALHLDEGWLVLVEDGREQRCHIAPGRILDDVVGPLVNRQIAVTGRWRGKTRLTFEVHDIYEWNEQTEPTIVSNRQAKLNDARGR